MAIISIKTDTPEGKAFRWKSTTKDFPETGLPLVDQTELHKRIQDSLDGENATKEELKNFMERWVSEK